MTYSWTENGGKMESIGSLANVRRAVEEIESLNRTLRSLEKSEVIQNVLTTYQDFLITHYELNKVHVIQEEKPRVDLSRYYKSQQDNIDALRYTLELSRCLMRNQT
jgi:hypothetical protein